MATLRDARVVVLAGLILAGCSDESQPRPAPEVGEVVRVVGGGDTYLPTLDGTEETTEVDGGNLAAMAVEPDGTLWLVHVNGEVFRAGPDGELVRALEAKVPPIADLAAVAIGPDGALFAVTDASDFLSRLDTTDPEAGWEDTPVVGVSVRSGFTGIAVGSDGTVYVADGFTGMVFRVDPDGRATPVSGTPAGDCSADRRFGPVGLAIGSSGALVVADPECPAPYRPGAGVLADPLDCPASPEGPVSPVAAAPGGDDNGLVVAGQSCQLVWMVPGGGGSVKVLADGQDFSGSVRGVAVDGDGIVYVLDDEGVVALRL